VKSKADNATDPKERRVRSYADLEQYLRGFAEGHYNFLWLTGRPGAGKTEAVNAALTGNVLRFKGGQLTPLALYNSLYEHRGQPVVLDDAEHILKDEVGRRLISALADTKPEKLLTYATSSRLRGAPAAFVTTSRLCVISNAPVGSKHEFLRSRAVCLRFDPTNLEIHRSVARWFWDQEVFDWFGRHVDRLGPLDARDYVKAFQDKVSGRCWRTVILDTLGPARAEVIVQDLEADPAYPTPPDRVRRFGELVGESGSGSRASYYRVRKKLQAEGRLTFDPAPRIPLRHTRPPEPAGAAALEVLATPPPPPREPEPAGSRPSAREAFANPNRNQARAAAPAAPQLDDTLPFEVRRDEEDSDDPAA
jgi:hypothetical protein